MRTRRVYRYYCDFCKLASLSKPKIAKHEGSCTLNPNRVCRLCPYLAQASGLHVPKPLPVLRELVGPCPVDIKRDYLLADDTLLAPLLRILRDAADGCPLCMLAAVRQQGWPAGIFGIDVKEEVKQIFVAADNNRTRDDS